ncbi:MAG: SDR family oxidoreductase [Gemmatimonadaceae bacterium]
MKLAGRVALVTGAGHRVGRALAVALGRKKMRVAVHYHSSLQQAQQTVAMIEDVGGTASVWEYDLAERDAPERLVADIVARMGTLDVVINSAAVMQRTPVGEVTADAWDSMFALNLRAPFFIAQAAAKVMGGDGAIVNIADLAAFETWPSYIPHAITKAGVVKMTESLARALAPIVRVNCIAPGAVLLPEEWDTDTAHRFAATTPLKRLGDPEDVVAAMLYLLSADYVTGETVVVDGGRRIRK